MIDSGQESWDMVAARLGSHRITPESIIKDYRRNFETCGLGAVPDVKVEVASNPDASNLIYSVWMRTDVLKQYQRAKY